MDATTLSPDLSANLQSLQPLFADSSDVVFHPLTIEGSLHAELIYVENLSNLQRVEWGILTPLGTMSREDALTPGHIETTLPVGKVTVLCEQKAAVQSVLSGNPILLVDGLSSAFSFGLAEWSQRAIEAPPGENVIRGPHEAFNETLATNLATMRRRVRSTELKTPQLTVGLVTPTPVAIVYLQNLARPGLVEEVKNRLQSVRYEQIQESGMLEELLQDQPYSLFPQLLSTERPDVVASHLLEGRVAIFTEGTPFVLICPGNFYSFIQSPEDYDNMFKGTLSRWLRYLFMIIALLLPAAYVAITTYHQEMIPTVLLLTIAKTREQVPFPALVEALLMELMFEALREAGLRLPKQVGAAVSIVGALVIGQAAISAGLVTPPMVMVVAITAIASFMIPHYALSIPFRMLRFPIMLLSGMLGLVGLVLGFAVIVIHLCGMKSFGVPYFSLQRPQSLADTLVRAPSRLLSRRLFLSARNEKKQGQLKKQPAAAQGRNDHGNQ